MGRFILILRDRRGATAIEYGLFMAFAALVLMSGMSSIGGSLNGALDKAGQAMAAQPGATAVTNTAAVTTIEVGDTQDAFLSNHQ